MGHFMTHSPLIGNIIVDTILTCDERTHANKWFMPLVWAGKMIGDGVEEGYIQAPTAGAMMGEVLKIRDNLQTLLSYDWLSVPLVYTQTVTIATYFYFAAALFGAQWIMPENKEMFLKVYNTPAGEFTKLDMLFPFFVVIQFSFFVGWLKVAETLINPFGEDDDDFELNRLVDRHLQVGYLTCDPTVEKPELLKDKFWNEIIPTDMPYTVGSEPYRAEEFRGSAEMTLDVKDEEKIYSESHYYSGAGDRESQVRKRKPSRMSRLSRETIYESIRSVVPNRRHPHKHVLERCQSSSSSAAAVSQPRPGPAAKDPEVNYAEVTLSEKEIKESYGIP